LPLPGILRIKKPTAAQEQLIGGQIPENYSVKKISLRASLIF